MKGVIKMFDTSWKKWNTIRSMARYGLYFTEKSEIHYISEVIKRWSILIAGGKKNINSKIFILFFNSCDTDMTTEKWGDFYEER